MHRQDTLYSIRISLDSSVGKDSQNGEKPNCVFSRIVDVAVISSKKLSIKERLAVINELNIFQLCLLGVTLTKDTNQFCSRNYEILNNVKAFEVKFVYPWVTQTGSSE